jgi:TAG lipase/steryl ester hydrolase/phospholipase A2/LPA acyltransferase
MLSLLTSFSTNKAEKQLTTAQTYAEWVEAAQMHDQISGKADWKEEEESSLYDYQIIRTRLDGLRKCRANGDDRGLLFILNEGIHGNLGGMGNAALHTVAKFGTKALINEYIDEIASALQYLGKLDNPDITFEEILDFFHRASHCFGRTALMLSGGAALGNFHLGVIKSLVEENLMPRVVSGASAGSVFAAMVGTNKRDKLKEFFKVENLLTASKQEANVFKRLWDNGYQKIDRDGVVEIINNFVADLTFKEAYELTHQHINITVSPAEQHQKPRLLNNITSPNVLVRSAVLASAAVPGVFPPVTLMAKGKDGEVKPYLPLRKWIDGSFSDDLPAKRLARLYGVNHYIVSLTNPFALPFATDPAHRGDLRHMAARLLKVGMREYATILGNLNRRFMKGFPRIESMLGLYYSVLSQSYTGDINIIYQFYLKDPRRLLTLLTPEEMMEMIRHGERATWPKIEAIRSCTKIGRILEDMLDDYEQRELSAALVGMKYGSHPRRRSLAGK